LFAGSTGEFCFAAPPTVTGFFGPPTAFWAEAMGDKPSMHAPTTIMTAIDLVLMDLILFRCAASQCRN